MDTGVLMSIKVNNIKYLNTLTKIKYPDNVSECPDWLRIIIFKGQYAMK